MESTYQTLLRSLRARHQQKLRLEVEERAHAEKVAPVSRLKKLFVWKKRKRKQEAVENDASEKIERAAAERTAQEEAKSNAIEKAKRKKAEKQAAQKVALTRDFSQFGTELKSIFLKALPILRVVGILGVVAVLFWGGSLVFPGFISLLPTMDPSATVTFTPTKRPTSTENLHFNVYEN